MIDSLSADGDLADTLDKTADYHVLDTARVILKQHDDEIANIRAAVRQFREQGQGAGIDLDEEEAILIADAERQARIKLQNLTDWFRWEFERWETVLDT